MKKAYFNWSGGKDSAYALYHALNAGLYEIEFLFSTVADGRVPMHQTGAGVLERQARAIGLPLRIFQFKPEWTEAEYGSAMRTYIDDFRDAGINVALFGDIHREDVRQRRIRQCQRNGIAAEFPIWGNTPENIVRGFIESKFRALITAIDCTVLPESFLGRVIDENFLAQYPSTADVCGENGEYHSFVFDGPLFSHPAGFQIARKSKPEQWDAKGNGSRYCALDIW